MADHDLRLSGIANQRYFNAQAMKKLEEVAIQRAQNAVMAAEKIINEGRLAVSGTIAVTAAAPKERILKEADDFGANLIVLGSHGHGGLTRWVLGSVSPVFRRGDPGSQTESGPRL